MGHAYLNAPLAKATGDTYRCTKVAWETREQVLANYRRSKLATLIPAERGTHLRPYRCKLCGYWHLGHTPRSWIKGGKLK